MANCPYCGRPVEITREAAPGSWSRLKPLELSVSSPWPSSQPPARDFSEYVRSEPVRAASWEADVLVCFGQSLGSGAFVATLATGLAVWQGWGWYVVAIAGAFTAAAVWFVTMLDGRAMLRRVERVVNRDLDGDGRIGAIQHEYTIRETRPDGSESWSIIVGLPVEPAKLREFAQGVLAGRTSTHTWGGVLERGDFERIRDRLISGGFARWSGENRNQGWELTNKGRAWFKVLAVGEPV